MPRVCEPATVADAAALMREAVECGERVAIEKGGGDVMLSTRRLSRLLEHEAGDLTATVEAGMRLSELDEQLARHGQMLALDPPGDPTVGACIAGNLSGPRRHRYGTARDLVLGVTVVLGDGTVASSGGKVVKNVAGYDLGKLFCNSAGTLGLVARASLRLHPRPQTTGTLVVDASSPDDASGLTRAVHLSQLAPSAVDLLWPGRLALLFEGGEAGVRSQLAAARELLGGLEDDGRVWEEAASLQSESAGKVSFPPAELGGLLRERPRALVRVSAGVAYVPEPVQAPLDEPLRLLIERVRASFDPQGVLVG